MSTLISCDYANDSPRNKDGICVLGHRVEEERRSWVGSLAREITLLTFLAVMQLQCLVQPVENDFVLVSQGTRLAMVLGPIFAGEFD